MTTFDKIAPMMTDFIAALDANSSEYFKKHYAESWARGWSPKHSAEFGKKFVRIVQENNGQRSAYCFIDADGNIYKCDGWKRPAKGVRGSLFDANFSIGKGLSHYGAAYAR